MLATALSVQLGGAVAATLIPQVGPMGTVALRITIATLIIAPLIDEALHLGYTRTDLHDLIDRVAESRGMYQ